jgi:EmrB/QacA subfamily drug resistance transporter
MGSGSTPSGGESRAGPVWLVLTVIGSGALVTALDQTVVVTALPALMLDLKVPITELDRVSWVITAYLLGYTVAMPVVGRLADVYGCARVYRVSLVVFMAGTTLVALAGSLEWVIGARVVQAVGGGATVPVGMAIAVGLLPPERRGLALGIVGGAAEAGAMLGPVYGGAIVEWLGWRWIFWLNVPQAALLLVALLWLPNQPNRQARVDYLGGAALIALLLTLSLAVSRQGLFTLSSPLPFIIGGFGLLLAALFAWQQRRSDAPLLPPVLFRSAALVTANSTQFLVGIALIIGLVTVPLMANTVMGRDPWTGALWLLRLTAAIPVGAILGGLALDALGARTVTVAGLLLAAAGLFLVGSWRLDVAEPGLTLHLVIAGLGFGLVIAPIAAHALDAVGQDHRAAVASLVVVSRMLGMTLGLAALSAWGVEHFQALTAGLELPLPRLGEPASEVADRVAQYQQRLNQAGLSVFHNFLRAAGVVTLAAIIPALLMRGNQEQTGVTISG